MFESKATLEPEAALLGPPRVDAARRKPFELAAKDVRRECDPATLGFRTTEEVPELGEVLGQARAEEAVRFGLAMRRPGYNLYALGPAGIGKHFVLDRYLKQQAAAEPAPDDWCYLFNFAEPQKPRTLRLPAGRGSDVRREMEELTGELKPALRQAFEREDYQNRRRAIQSEFEGREESAFRELGARAREKGLAVMRTPVGMMCAPAQGEEVLSPEDVDKLPAEEQERIRREIEAVGKEMEELLGQMPRWQRERKEKIRELNREVTRFAVGALLDEVRKSFADQEAVARYLDEVEHDILDNAPQIVDGDEEEDDAEAILGRYRINLLVDNGEIRHAPVVQEENPTYPNLVGRVEHISEMGTLITDFTLIKPGALHRANGGYLVLDARKVLLQPFAWEGLKRALQAGHLKIESPGQAWSLLSTVSLEPEPIPLAVKVVLVGERLLYYLLAALDPEFPELFKVAVDFEEDLDRGEESQQLYARLIAGLLRQEGLKPFDCAAVARVLEHSSRLAEDARKLSLHARELLDLLREAAHWSGQSPVVTAGDVQRAIDAQIRRVDRVRERMQEEVRRGTLLLDTAGAVAGQVNGLSVLQLGSFSFGHPGRITARVRLGEGEVVDIEREAELSGPIHSKGVLILTGFLGGRYAGEQPLSLSASLVFEQSYGEVEGDSASLAELCALLSAISEIPLDQGKAVTGSVDQLGRAQAVGGINEKIEGFFDVCAARELDGRQGVVIPESNVQHLMLRRDVVEAVAAGKFHVYPVATVDEALEVLTGLPAGERDVEGNYPEGSVNRAVMDRLSHLAERRRDLAREEVRSIIPL